MNGFLGWSLEELVAVTGSNGDVADLRAFENAQGDFNACIAQGPHLPVKVGEPIHSGSS
jgi:hypothetical protein